MSMKHFRDYAYSQVKGGSKGEKADYILYGTADARELRFAPIVSKIKLNKKRKALVADPDEAYISKNSQPENIVITSRGYSKDEAMTIKKQLENIGNTNYKIAANIVAFENKDGIVQTEKGIASSLKEVFKEHLLTQLRLKQEKEEAEFNVAEKVAPSDQSEKSDNSSKFDDDE